MSTLDPQTERVRDPLSPVARKQRLSLLTSSLIAILFVDAGLVPAKLSIMGTEFNDWDQDSLIWILLCVTIYFAVCFLIYVSADYTAYRMRILAADTVADSEYEGLLARQANNTLSEQDKILLFRYDLHDRVFQLSKPLGRSRLIVEMLLPLAFSAYAIFTMTRFVVGAG